MCKYFIRELKPENEQKIARDLNVQNTITDVLRLKRKFRSMTDS